MCRITISRTAALPRSKQSRKGDECKEWIHNCGEGARGAHVPPCMGVHADVEVPMRSCFPHLHSAMCAKGAASHLSSDGNPSTCDPRDFPTLVYMADGPGLTLHTVCSDSSQNKCGFTGNWGLPLEAQFGHEKSSLGSSECTQQCNFDLIFHLAFFEEAKTLVCHRSAWRQQVVYFSKKKKPNPSIYYQSVWNTADGDLWVRGRTSSSTATYIMHFTTFKCSDIAPFLNNNI